MLCTATALESESTIASDLEGPPHSEEAVRLDLDGFPGVWLPLDMAKEMQKDAESAVILWDRNESLEHQLSIRGERLDKCKEALDVSKDSESKALESAKELDEVSDKLQEELDSPLRNPFVWIGVGVGATIAVEVLIFVLINSAP